MRGLNFEGTHTVYQGRVGQVIMRATLITVVPSQHTGQVPGFVGDSRTARQSSQHCPGPVLWVERGVSEGCRRLAPDNRNAPRGLSSKYWLADPAP